jgi:hypothetical protein
MHTAHSVRTAAEPGARVIRRHPCHHMAALAEQLKSGRPIMPAAWRDPGN